MGHEFNPFIHHPELRGKIADPLRSFSRTITTTLLAAKMRELELPSDWWYPDDVREVMRQEALAEHLGHDLWVFGYGSLMWDPGFRFTEVRRAYLPHYARKFILKDIYGGRGTSNTPGLMAALDNGTGCEGLLFRISRQNLDKETEVLWRREQIGPAYLPSFVETIVSGEHVTALTFVADYSSVLIDTNMTRAQQIEYLATGTGFLGSSLEYLENVVRQCAALGIVDEDAVALLRETETYIGEPD